jgi:hypothetical protein
MPKNRTKTSHRQYITYGKHHRTSFKSCEGLPRGTSTLHGDAINATHSHEWIILEGSHAEDPFLDEKLDIKRYHRVTHCLKHDQPIVMCLDSSVVATQVQQ